MIIVYVGINNLIFRPMTLKISITLNDERQPVLSNNADINTLNPKELMLYAAAKCDMLTILGILRENAVLLTEFELSVEGRLSTPTVVAESRFLHFNIIYNARCPKLKDQAIVSRAITLAHDKYCGLVQMYRQIAPVMREISIVTTEE